MSAKILVLGGSGLIGGELCRQAAERGHVVVGLSRGGAPDSEAPWTERVHWVAADALQPEQWREHLRGCTAVAHCIGIVRERPARGVTFQRVNGDSAILAGREAQAAGVQRFVFVSASAKPPLLGEGYITAKRRAEQELRELDLTTVVLRPGMVSGPRRPASLLADAALRVGMRVPGVDRLAAGFRPLPVRTVARCALRAALEPTIGGTLDIDDIQRLGEVAG